jgi:hypothetical protein
LVTNWANPNNLIGAVVGDNAWNNIRPAGLLGMTQSSGASDYFSAMGVMGKIFSVNDLEARLATWSRNFPVPGLSTIFNDRYIAVYGTVPDPCPTGGKCWAGFFNGDVEITKQIKITGGNPGEGKILTSDANGLARWEPPADSTSPYAVTIFIDSACGEAVQKKCPKDYKYISQWHVGDNCKDSFYYDGHGARKEGWVALCVRDK